MLQKNANKSPPACGGKTPSNKRKNMKRGGERNERTELVQTTFKNRGRAQSRTLMGLHLRHFSSKTRKEGDKKG